MKTIKFFMAAIAMMASSSVFAQFANGGSSSSMGKSGSGEEYSRFTVSYTMGGFDIDGSYDSELEPAGVTVGLIHGKPLNTSLPLTLEYGANLTWMNYTDEDDYYTFSLNMLDVTVPVNIAYSFELSDGVFLTPFAGPSARINILASGKDTYDDGYYDETEKISYFDKDDVGKNGVWSRFQIGAQVGVGLTFNKYYVGYQYQWDFMEISKKVTTNRNMLTVGVNF